VLAVLVLTGAIRVWEILGLGIFSGLIQAFDIPVRQSFVVEMIEKKKDLSNAIALNSVLINIARLLGPVIAGVLITLVGEGWCFSINAASFLAILLSLSLMRIKPRAFRPRAAGALQEFKEGCRYAFGFPPIRSVLMLLALVSMMGMPYQVLMPVFAKDVLKGGAHSLGFLMSAAGVGALTGAFYLASRKSPRGLGQNIVVAAAIFGTGLVIFGLSKIFWLSWVTLIFVGFGMLVQMTACNTVLQTLVDDDKRGRVMSFYSMAFMGTVPFGNLLAGTLAHSIGAPTTVALGGTTCLLGAAYAAFRLPAMRKIVHPIYAEKEAITLAEMESVG
jgi:MFS family permease